MTSVSLQSGTSTLPEDTGAISVCVEIHTIQSEELELDVRVGLTIDNITAGVSAFIPTFL